MAFEKTWSRGWGSCLSLTLALFSIALIGMFAADVSFTYKSVALENKIHHYDPFIAHVIIPKDIIAGLIFAIFMLFFSLSIFILMLRRKGNGIAIGSVAILLAIAWLGIVGYQLHLYISTENFGEGLTQCSNDLDFYGPTRAAFYSNGCSYIRVQFSGTVVAFAAVVLLIILAIIAFCARASDRRADQLQQTPAGGQQIPGMVAVPVQPQSSVLREQTNVQEPQASPLQGTGYMQPGQVYSQAGQQYVLVPVQYQQNPMYAPPGPWTTQPHSPGDLDSKAVSSRPQAVVTSGAD